MSRLLHHVLFSIHFRIKITWTLNIILIHNYWRSDELLTFNIVDKDFILVQLWHWWESWRWRFLLSSLWFWRITHQSLQVSSLVVDIHVGLLSSSSFLHVLSILSPSQLRRTNDDMGILLTCNLFNSFISWRSFTSVVPVFIVIQIFLIINSKVGILSLKISVVPRISNCSLLNVFISYYMLKVHERIFRLFTCYITYLRSWFARLSIHFLLLFLSIYFVIRDSMGICVL